MLEKAFRLPKKVNRLRAASLANLSRYYQRSIAAAYERSGSRFFNSLHERRRARKRKNEGAILSPIVPQSQRL